MKKAVLLNSEITSVIARMGHTDRLVIGDAGLPVPEGVRRIDLALAAGLPGFAETLKTVLTELKVEKAILATEITEKNKPVFEEVFLLCQKEGITLEWVDHESFKRATGDAKAVIRTGECTPYANIILQSGVVF